MFTDGLYTKEARDTHSYYRELIGKWLWEPKVSSLEYIYE